MDKITAVGCWEREIKTDVDCLKIVLEREIRKAISTLQDAELHIRAGGDGNICGILQSIGSIDSLNGRYVKAKEIFEKYMAAKEIDEKEAVK